MNVAQSPADIANDLSARIATAAAAGVKSVEGKPYMTDAKGKLIPVVLVKPVDQLMDETVRRMVAYAIDLSEQVARFKGHCFDDLGAFQALIAEKYGASVGGEKGNVSLTSFDGCLRVTFQVQDRFTFGPEFKAAKALIDECLAEWSAGSRNEIIALVNRAFSVDQEGTINRADVFTLLRIDSPDERWQRAMTAIHDSIRVIGSATYIRFHSRPDPKAKWSGITIDLASA